MSLREKEVPQNFGKSIYCHNPAKILILQVKTVRLREIKQFVQSHTGEKQKHIRKLIFVRFQGSFYKLKNVTLFFNFLSIRVSGFFSPQTLAQAVDIVPTTVIALSGVRKIPAHKRTDFETMSVFLPFMH